MPVLGPTNTSCRHDVLMPQLAEIARENSSKRGRPARQKSRLAREVADRLRSAEYEPLRGEDQFYAGKVMTAGVGTTERRRRGAEAALS